MLIAIIRAAIIGLYLAVGAVSYFIWRSRK